jgi:hypothetical protein
MPPPRLAPAYPPPRCPCLPPLCVQVAVCTPGRMIDLIKMKACNMKRCTYLVRRCAPAAHPLRTRCAPLAMIYCAML